MVEIWCWMSLVGTVSASCQNGRRSPASRSLCGVPSTIDESQKRVEYTLIDTTAKYRGGVRRSHVGRRHVYRLELLPEDLDVQLTLLDGNSPAMDTAYKTFELNNDVKVRSRPHPDSGLELPTLTFSDPTIG